MIALLGLILIFLGVHGLETGFKDKIDRIMDVLETGSDADRNVVFTTRDSAVNWQVILEQCILQKKDAALTAVLNYPNFIDWAGSSSDFLLNHGQFVAALQQLKADEAYLFDYSNQGKIITGFVIDHEEEINKLSRTLAADIADFVLYWMVSVKSFDDVQNILNHVLLLNSVSEKAFELLIGVCIQDDNVEVFKVFMENTNSQQRVKKNSKSIWSFVFPRILDYNMNLVQTRNRRPSQLMNYILSSKVIMQMMDAKIVALIFYASRSNYELLARISRNEEAMKKVHTAGFSQARLSKMISMDLKRNVMNEATVRLWLTTPSLSFLLNPQTLGLIFVESSEKNWMDIIEIFLDRDILLDEIDVTLLNKGIQINTDEHLEVIGSKLIGSSPLLGKLESKSVGVLFSRFLALQHENVINAFLEREVLISLVSPDYLAKGIDGLIVEDVASHTERILGLFLNSKYIARITDDNWLNIVKHSVRYNKKQVLDLIFQQNSILCRLPTFFLKKVERYVTQDKKAAIKKILKERDPDTFLSGIKKSVDRFKDRRVRPQNTFSFPILTADQITQQFKEMKEMVKEMTKDGHELTPADQERIMNAVLEHHVPKLPSLMP